MATCRHYCPATASMRTLLVAAILLSNVWIATAAAQSAKIGYIDMARLVRSSPQVIEGRSRLEAEFEGRDQVLKAEESRLQELETRERRDAAVLPKAAAQALQNEIVTLKRSIERTRKKLAADLKTRLDEEVNRRWPEVNDAIVEFARANGYDLIVPAPVLYASPSIDITNQVLEKLRATAKKTGENP